MRVEQVVPFPNQPNHLNSFDLSKNFLWKLCFNRRDFSHFTLYFSLTWSWLSAPIDQFLWVGRSFCHLAISLSFDPPPLQLSSNLLKIWDLMVWFHWNVIRCFIRGWKWESEFCQYFEFSWSSSCPDCHHRNIGGVHWYDRDIDFRKIHRLFNCQIPDYIFIFMWLQD